MERANYFGMTKKERNGKKVFFFFLSTSYVKGRREKNEAECQGMARKEKREINDRFFPIWQRKIFFEKNVPLFFSFFPSFFSLPRTKPAYGRTDASSIYAASTHSNNTLLLKSSWSWCLHWNAHGPCTKLKGPNPNWDVLNFHINTNNFSCSTISYRRGILKSIICLVRKNKLWKYFFLSFVLTTLLFHFLNLEL